MDKTLQVLAEGSLPSASDSIKEDDLTPTSTHPYLAHKVQVLDTVQRKDRFVPVASLHRTDLNTVKSALPEPAKLTQGLVFSIVYKDVQI